MKRFYFTKGAITFKFFKGLGFAVAKEDTDYYIIIGCIVIEICIYKPKKHTYYENVPKNN